jgi:3-oxoacyl-[acyl-carrier protein] reductase
MRLEGKVAAVTGGGQGIGEAVARAFDREGARVAILDIDLDAAQRTIATMRHGMAIWCDVGDSSSVDAAFDAVVGEFGTLDVLAHVAAVKASTEEFRRLRRWREQQAAERAAGGPVTATLEATVNMTDEQWERQIRVDLSGTFFCTRAALRIMGPKRSGTIITTSSNSAISGWAGIANYTAAKAGVLGFTRSVAQEVIGQGIRVNAIAPGGVDTPMPSAEVEALKRAGAASGPMGRLADPDELAAAYVFLASDESSYIVGETLNVNGGILTV